MFEKLLQALGLPTTNAQGHELGCACETCRDARDRRDREPLKPGTVGAVLRDAIKDAPAGSLGAKLREAAETRIDPIEALHGHKCGPDCWHRTGKS